MELKSGVTLIGLQLPMRRVLKVADLIWGEYGEGLVVTAAVEDGHSPASFHPFGMAIDLRTRYFTSVTASLVASELRKALPNDYDVVRHSTHIHVEYDPK